MEPKSSKIEEQQIIRFCHVLGSLKELFSTILRKFHEDFDQQFFVTNLLQQTTNEGEEEELQLKFNNYQFALDLLKKLDILHQNSSYVLSKSRCKINIENALNFNFWRLMKSQEEKIRQLYNCKLNVLLIVVHEQSMEYVAYGRVIGPPLNRQQFLKYIDLNCNNNPPSSSSSYHKILNWFESDSDRIHDDHLISDNFIPVDWISMRKFNFSIADHLLNKLDNNNQLRFSPKFANLDSRCGETLCRMFPIDDLHNSNLNLAVLRCEKLKLERFIPQNLSENKHEDAEAQIPTISTIKDQLIFKDCF